VVLVRWAHRRRVATRLINPGANNDNVSILDGGMAAWTREQDKTKANPAQAGAYEGRSEPATKRSSP
jgi:3-mercaptopyruvate sulfurtransferase SseA